MSLLQKPVEQLAPLLKTKQVSPLELVRECLERIEKTEPLVNAYISVLDESALVAAKEAEQEILNNRNIETGRVAMDDGDEDDQRRGAHKEGNYPFFEVIEEFEHAREPARRKRPAAAGAHKAG